MSLGVIPDAMRLDRDELLQIDRSAGTIEAEIGYVLGHALHDANGVQLPDLFDWLDRTERLLLLHAVRAVRFFATETGCVDNLLPPLPFPHRGWDLVSLERCFERFALKTRDAFKSAQSRLQECWDANHEGDEVDPDVSARVLEESSLHLCEASRMLAVTSSLVDLAAVCRAFKSIHGLIVAHTSDA